MKIKHRTSIFTNPIEAYSYTLTFMTHRQRDSGWKLELKETEPLEGRGGTERGIETERDCLYSETEIGDGTQIERRERAHRERDT